ncbi:MAG: hypothetical protein AB7S38_18375 [Vulcanimicrobiota bacterium]
MKCWYCRRDVTPRSAAVVDPTGPGAKPGEPWVECKRCAAVSSPEGTLPFPPSPTTETTDYGQLLLFMNPD